MNKRCGAGMRHCSLIALMDLSLFMWLKCVSGPEDTGSGEKTYQKEKHKDEGTVTSAWLNELESREHLPIQTEYTQISDSSDQACTLYIPS